MVRISTPLIGCGAALLALLLPGPSQAQTQVGRQRRGSVTKIEIFNGPTRTVRYFSNNLTPAESATVRELETLENESSYARDLQTVKREYVRSEQVLEPNRRLVKQLLYNPDNLVWPTYAAWPGAYGWGGSYGYGLPSAHASYFRSPYVNTAYLPAAGPAYGYLSGPVAGGLPDDLPAESRIKDAMSAVIAREATPEYVTQLQRQTERVALRATTSPTLRVAFGLPETKTVIRERNDYRLASGEVSAPGAITITLKGGDQIRALKMNEDGDWFVIETAEESLRIRQSEVVRISRPRNSGSGIVPAAGK